MSSPLTTPLSKQTRQYGTPNSLRNRHDNSTQPQFIDETSPTSTLSDPAPTVAHRLNEAPRSTFRNVFASSTHLPGRNLAVHSDPSLLTCFDPTDKELYDLWVPRK